MSYGYSWRTIVGLAVIIGAPVAACDLLLRWWG